MLTFFYRKLASNLVMLIARRLLFYGLYNTENVMNEITGTCGQDPMLLPPFFSSFFCFFLF